jgi:tetratricopeptide (TPR) repeat protein
MRLTVAGVALAAVLGGMVWFAAADSEQASERSRSAAQRRREVSERHAARRMEQWQSRQEAFRILRQERDYSRAERLMLEVLNADRNNGWTWRDLCRFYDEAGKAELALEAYRTFLTPHREWGSNLQEDSTIWFRFAEIADSLGRTTDVNWAYRHILGRRGAKAGAWMPRISPLVRNDMELRAHAYVRVGLLEVMRGARERGRSLIRRASELDPECPTVRYYLGWSLQEAQQYPEARIEYERAGRLGTSDPQMIEAVKWALHFCPPGDP